MMEYSPESVMREEGYPKSFGLLELECLGVGGMTGPDFRGSKSAAGIWILIRFLHGSLLRNQPHACCSLLHDCYREE